MSQALVSKELLEKALLEANVVVRTLGGDWTTGEQFLTKCQNVYYDTAAIKAAGLAFKRCQKAIQEMAEEAAKTVVKTVTPIQPLTNQNNPQSADGMVETSTFGQPEQTVVQTEPLDHVKIADILGSDQAIDLATGKDLLDQPKEPEVPFGGDLAPAEQPHPSATEAAGEVTN